MRCSDCNHLCTSVVVYESKSAGLCGGRRSARFNKEVTAVDGCGVFMLRPAPKTNRVLANSSASY